MQTLTFDIETIPIENNDPYFQLELNKVVDGLIVKRFPTTAPTPAELENLFNLAGSVSPYLGKIIVIGIHYKDNAGNIQTDALYGDDEKEILLKFWDYLRQFKGTFVSFNGLIFDAPFIIKRSMFHRIIPTNNDFINLKRFSINPHFDVKMIIGDWDKYATGTLDTITNFLGVPSPKEGAVIAADVYQAYKDGRIKEVADYCLRDVVATYEVYDIIKDYVFTPFKNQ